MTRASLAALMFGMRGGIAGPNRAGLFAPLHIMMYNLGIVKVIHHEGNTTMQLKTYTDYGLRVLAYVGVRRDRSVPRSEIARAYHISPEHLRKVIHRMGQLGYLETTQGKSGGVKLGRSPSLIRLGNFVLEMEESMEIIDCSKQDCPLQGGCTIKSAVNFARDAFISALNEYTLEMILDDTKMAKQLRIVEP